MNLVIYAYGDDGSDEKKERVMAVAVVAGREEWWRDTERKWKTRCGQIPFHATDCESNKKDYKNTSREDNRAMYHDLVTIMAASKVGGLGIAIDLTSQKRIVPGALPLAYYRAFLECIERVANVAENYGEIAEITFDISAENEHNAALLYSWARDKDGRLRKWLGPKLSFVPWRESARIQTADMLAFEAWKSLDHTVGPVKRKRGSWDALRATGRFASLSYSENWFRDLKVDIDSGKLEKVVGFNESDYLAWLKKTGRQHNISNVFHFLHWIDNKSEG